MINFNVYTDGSFSTNNPKVTRAGVVVADDLDEVLCLRHAEIYNQTFVKSRNVGGELMAAVLAVAEVVRLANGVPATATIHHDYTGVAFAMNGEWKKIEKPSVIQYVALMKKTLNDNPNIKLRYKKIKAHSGIPLNDLADAVAANMIPRMYSHLEQDCIRIP